MKFRHFMAFLMFLSLTTGAIAQTKPAVKMIGATPKSGVHMTFENEHIDIGKVKRGEIKKFDFVFTNTGTEIIEIDIASGCDCTTLDYPKNKILPGKKGTIHVIFDSAKNGYPDRWDFSFKTTQELIVEIESPKPTEKGNPPSEFMSLVIGFITP